MSTETGAWLAELAEQEAECLRIAKRFRIMSRITLLAAGIGVGVAILLSFAVDDGEVTCWGLIAWMLVGMFYGDLRRKHVYKADQAASTAAILADIRLRAGQWEFFPCSDEDEHGRVISQDSALD